MVRKRSRVPVNISLHKTDDLKLIKGIGPVLAGRLHNGGIHTFAELASMSPARLAARVSGLSSRKIAVQAWIAQARELASEKKRSRFRKKEAVKRTIRQHYENFTVEILLDDKNKARRTRVVHIQSGDADTWPGWEATQLTEFVVRHAALRILQAKSVLEGNESAHNEISQSASEESVSTVFRTSDPAPVFAVETRLEQPANAKAGPISQSLNRTNLAGALRVRELKVVTVDSDIPIFFLQSGQPYLLRLILDLEDVVAPNDAQLICRATIFAKQFGGPSPSVTEMSNVCRLSDTASLDIVGAGLAAGTYRLEAFVRLASEEATPGLTASLKGNLIQVY
jgi:hypothetical protein